MGLSKIKLFHIYKYIFIDFAPSPKPPLIESDNVGLSHASIAIVLKYSKGELLTAAQRKSTSNEFCRQPSDSVDSNESRRFS